MKNKKGLLIAVLVLSALILIIILRTFLFSGGNTCHASVVDRGLVYVSVDASGIVEPENEVLILSPVSSIIKEIKKEPGSRVQKGMYD